MILEDRERVKARSKRKGKENNKKVAEVREEMEICAMLCDVVAWMIWDDLENVYIVQSRPLKSDTFRQFVKLRHHR